MSKAAADALVDIANELLRAEKFSEAVEKFDRAAQVYPLHPLAWRGLGHAYLCLGQLHEATRSFDRAIGLRPDSATALWGGAVAHAEVGNKVVAQNYLRRAIALQPTWRDLAETVPLLAPFLQVSTGAADGLRAVLGNFSTRSYHHAVRPDAVVDVGQLRDRPSPGLWTYATIGLSNTRWPELGRPRVELLMATLEDAEACGQILANLAFHLADTSFFPEPGVLVRDVIGALALGDLSRRLPHVYIAVPRLWRLSLPLVAGPPPVTLAQVVAVSEAEAARWRADPVTFEREVAQRHLEVLDLARAG